ncbi:MAG: hypothetical protein LBR12_05015 [Opitutaceae bacterium]|nr:hypothetical protein [Opitutaceae bacterium]
MENPSRAARRQPNFSDSNSPRSASALLASVSLAACALITPKRLCFSENAGHLRSGTNKNASAQPRDAAR